MVNCILNSSGLPHNLWGEALLIANLVLNRIPHKKIDKSPCEVWNGKQPSYKILKVWGCLVKVQVPLPKRTKLGPKTIDCVFIGYALHSVAYRFLVIKSEIPDINNNTIIESIEVELFENIFPFKEERHNDNGSKRKYETSSSEGQVGLETKVEPRRSKRAKKAISFELDFLTYMVRDKPQTYNNAMTSFDAPYWKEAVNSEMKSIMQNQTWVLV